MRRRYNSPAKMRRFRNLVMGTIALEVVALFWITQSVRPLG